MRTAKHCSGGMTRRQMFSTAAGLVASLPLLAACRLGAAPPATPAKVTPGPSKKAVNSVGVELPEDAAPPEQQVYRFTLVEGTHLDVSGNMYDGFASGDLKGLGPLLCAVAPTEP